MRDIDTLTRQQPADAGLTAWADGVHAIYQSALAEVLALAGASDAARRAAHRRYQAEVLTLCQPFVADPAAPPAVLGRRIEQYLHALFIFVLVPGVSATNNLAERSVRHEVISRKISGGTRSSQGTATRATLATLFGTWRAQEREPFTACRDLLVSPQV